jgi:hypothetical protein
MLSSLRIVSVATSARHDSAPRLAALSRWRARNPAAEIDPTALTEAAGIATMVEVDGLDEFDDETFGDLAAFIAEMPF